MAKKPVRPRTMKRAEERKYAGLVKDRARLAALEPGGSEARAIAVSSASLVEPEARNMPCVLCGGGVRVEEHAAKGGLRHVHVLCMQCGARRTVYFRIDALPN
jgi:hypothetical protein